MDATARSIVQTVRQPLLVLDEEQRIRFANGPFRSMFRLNEDEVEGKSLADLDGGQWNQPELHRLIGEIIPRHEIIEDYEVRLRVPDGGCRILFLNGRRIVHDMEDTPFILLSFEDVTERMEAHRRLERLNTELEERVRRRTRQLEAVNRELEAFCYSVSHDLRAPLRAIDGFSNELLRSYADRIDDRGRHYLDRIRRGTQRMGELIDDLLKLSRVNRSEFSREQVDLSAIAQGVARELQNEISGRTVDFMVESGLTAWGDGALLRIAMENLLSNAWKFTSKKEVAVIRVGEETDGDVSAFYVRDNGAGFDMAYAGKLFGAFQRLHSEREFPGNGIGLATVHRIIHRHGGRIWAEAAPEQGAVFRFTIPKEDAE